MINLMLSLIIYGSEPNLVGVYVISGIMTLIGFLGLIVVIIRISSNSVNSVLDEMLKNGDINYKVYQKYKT